jgi:uncharacterized protein (DUF2267 family)
VSVPDALPSNHANWTQALLFDAVLRQYSQFDDAVQEHILCVSAREANAAVERFLKTLDDKVPGWVGTSLRAILPGIAAHVAKSATAAVVKRATAALLATLPKRPKSANQTLGKPVH